PVPVHVGAHDVHLPGVTGADLGAIHLFARARRRGLRVQCAHPQVGLPQGVGVDASAGANAAVAASARSGPHPLSPSPFGRGGTRRLILVLEAGDVGTAVAPQLSLDPVHRGAVSVRALAAVTESGETLDRRLVLLEVEPRDEL